MENHHFQWESSLFLCQFSMAMLNYQRVLLDIPKFNGSLAPIEFPSFICARQPVESHRVAAPDSDSLAAGCDKGKTSLWIPGACGVPNFPMADYLKPAESSSDVTPQLKVVVSFPFLFDFVFMSSHSLFFVILLISFFFLFPCPFSFLFLVLIYYPALLIARCS